MALSVCRQSPCQPPPAGGLTTRRSRVPCLHRIKFNALEVSMSLIVVLVIIVLAVLFLVSTYNGLVTSRNAFKNAFPQMDVKLPRRYDLTPNLVETAKGYMKHEREPLEAVISARNGAIAGPKAAAANPADAAAVQQLSGAE